jgi:FkbM family methyltransferase
MSRLSKLIKHLSFADAARFYWQMKRGRYNDFRLKKLQHPFSLRDNPYDYATFEEVLLREDYRIDLGFEPRTIIDGGANIGLTSLYFANKYPRAKIVSVEPEVANFELLQKNTAPYPAISLVRAGIWNRMAWLSVVDSGMGHNAFTVEEVSPDHPGALKAVSIADILVQQGWEGADVVKLDIEGSEKKVFESHFESWLPQTKVLIIELHDRMQAGCSDTVLAALSKYHFSEEVKGENHIFYNRDLV